MLVIVDIQDHYAWGQWDEEMSWAVAGEIADAIKQDKPIVTVTYRGAGPLKPVVAEMIGDYANHIAIEKRGINGSLTLWRKLAVQRWQEEVRFCGGNITWCLGQTVLGLAKRLRRNNIEPRFVVNLSASYENGRAAHRFAEYYNRFAEQGIQINDPDGRWWTPERLTLEYGSGA
jgi:hypothetical protein